MCLAACLARRLFPKLTRAFVSPLSAERDQQLDMATRVCEALVRRLRETERTLATADADRAERSELLEAEVQTDEAELLTSSVVAPPAAPTLRSLLGLPMLRVAAARLLLPLHLLHWVLPNMPLVSPLLQRLTQGLAPAGAAVESAGAPGADAVGAAGTAELEASTDDRMGREEDEDEDEEADEDVEDADEDVAMEEEDGDEEEDDDEEEDEEGDEDEDEGDDEDDDEDDEDDEEARGPPRCPCRTRQRPSRFARACEVFANAWAPPCVCAHGGTARTLVRSRRRTALRLTRDSLGGVRVHACRTTTTIRPRRRQRRRRSPRKSLATTMIRRTFPTRTRCSSRTNTGFVVVV